MVKVKVRKHHFEYEIKLEITISVSNDYKDFVNFFNDYELKHFESELKGLGVIHLELMFATWNNWIEDDYGEEERFENRELKIFIYYNLKEDIDEQDMICEIFRILKKSYKEYLKNLNDIEKIIKSVNFFE